MSKRGDEMYESVGILTVDCNCALNVNLAYELMWLAIERKIHEGIHAHTLNHVMSKLGKSFEDGN